MARKSWLSAETLGEAMRPEMLRNEEFALSNEERDYVTEGALRLLQDQALELAQAIAKEEQPKCSQIRPLLDLFLEVGWHRHSDQSGLGDSREWPIGRYLEPWRLEPWLERWIGEDTELLAAIENAATAAGADDTARRDIVEGYQAKLGTGALLLARLEKWTASRGN